MMRIGVADTMGAEHKFQRYIVWLHSAGIPLEYIRLSHAERNLKEFDSCDGLLLTGGHDVDPSLYHGPVGHPRITNVDPARDNFERKLLERALERRVPVLGICRGMQLANVHFGGSLVPDLEEAGYRSHRCDTWECRHDITIEKNSEFSGLIGESSGIVNSSHHQGVAVPAPGLVVSARSDDGVVEAMDLGAPYPFFHLVQYHPERMEDTANPFAEKLLVTFLHSITYAIEQTK